MPLTAASGNNTERPRKLVCLVGAMVADGEWQQQYQLTLYPQCTQNDAWKDYLVIPLGTDLHLGMERHQNANYLFQWEISKGAIFPVKSLTTLRLNTFSSLQEIIGIFVGSYD
ncbi:predicted protein [Histoplasma capsulatum G186AR]|uniref:Uncharacterized protein n=1 Tax=Ajellomyces capsulatus (strain G186AR / H82 / ATCC MYA-2454 / RMSCC 2432) TaxID=447093 RepID=C0NHW6_AJECG|nr:uncharacterized protein HCBG_02938 [Histoplasma capsulatum G186AR]EEH09401.1 predicted protein [Histoplasma capsulatum G186AR]